ncbi:MAG: tripartite tricarboxylate transporter substrate-binding protein [Deltaproteobacteria bacterium]|nr:tripartite tricarboxylate transporter substrate-binding protein [Deltaproteobacteria bacterium]
MTKRAIGRTLIVLLLAGFFFMSFSGQATAKDFYEGKVLRILVCCSPGGFYDRWARLFARHLGKHIPGKPDIIVQNMPGAGSLIAANYVYNIAKQDGTAIVMPLAGLYLDQVVGRKEVRFDIAKFQWIGTQEVSQTVLFCRSDSKYTNIDALIKNKKEPARIGNTGTAGNSFLIGKVLEQGVGANFNFVMGYAGGSEVDLAVERGEVLCRGMSSAPFFGREPFLTWRKNKFVTEIAQSGSERDPRIKDTPTLSELMEKHNAPELVRSMSKVIFASGQFGRPFAVAPGVPADRVKILRDAYAAALNDPDLAAEAKKGRMVPFKLTRGEDLQELAKSVVSQPKEVVDGVKALLGR